MFRGSRRNYTTCTISVLWPQFLNDIIAEIEFAKDIYERRQIKYYCLFLLTILPAIPTNRQPDG